MKLEWLLVIDVGKVKIGLVHGDGGGYSTPLRAVQSFSGVQCVVFGHTHRPDMKGTVIHCSLTWSPTDHRMMPMGPYGGCSM